MAESESRSVVSDSLWHPWTSPLNSPGQNTGVGSLYLLLGVFPTQGRSSPGLPHCRWILYQLNHKRSPRILEWVAYPFSGGSSQPRNWTGVSCIAGRFFTNWAIREAVLYIKTLVFIHAIYTSLHLLIPNSQSSLPIPTWQLQICSLCLWLCFYFADKFICTIF